MQTVNDAETINVNNDTQKGKGEINNENDDNKIENEVDNRFKRFEYENKETMSEKRVFHISRQRCNTRPEIRGLARTIGTRNAIKRNKRRAQKVYLLLNIVEKLHNIYRLKRKSPDDKYKDI